MIPVVRGVISASIRSGSRVWVSARMSANTGVICCHWRACAVATKVYDGTITSPVRSSARIAISSAMVALVAATQCRTPRCSAIRRSSSCTYGPWLVSQRRSSMLAMRAMRRARSPTFGRPTCSGSAKAGVPPKIASDSRSGTAPAEGGVTETCIVLYLAASVVC